MRVQRITKSEKPTKAKLWSQAGLTQCGLADLQAYEISENRKQTNAKLRSSAGLKGTTIGTFWGTAVAIVVHEPIEAGLKGGLVHGRQLH